MLSDINNLIIVMICTISFAVATVSDSPKETSVPYRNPRYTPPRVNDLGCKDAYPPSMLDTAPEQNHSPESEISFPSTVVTGKDNRYIEVSDGFCKLVGYSREQLLQMKLEDLAAPGTVDIIATFNPSKTAGRAHGLWLLVTRDGTRVLVRYNSRLRNDDFLIQSQLELIGVGY
jgi:PAS domain S-box-containing protein